MKIYTEDMQEKPFDGGCVATIGFFDGVHLGHRFLLDFVSGIGAERNLPTVVVTFPDSPSRVLHPSETLSLLSTEQEKRQLLLSHGVDQVVMIPFTTNLASCTASSFMRDVLRDQLRVAVLVMGYDHRFGNGGGGTFSDYERYGRELGIEVVLAPAYKTDSSTSQFVSSSSIRAALKNGDIDCANACLGYEYFLEGTVVGGYHIGSKLGYPTANLSVSPLKLIPAPGAYAVRVELDGWNGFGMLNVGRRPTLGNGDELSIEVHIFDFHENIYSEQMRVSFVRYIRPEQKFDSVEVLKKQLQIDESICRSIFSD